METNYTMIGADGVQYGPITLDQLRAWVTEGRIVHDTKILRSDTNAWLNASQYVELGLSPPVPVATAPPPTPLLPANRFDPVLEQRMRQGARWFYWIAGLSMINSIIAMSRNGIVFVVGLTVTRFIDVFASRSGTGGTIALLLNLIIAGMFALFGVFAMKRQSWSFIVGMVLYAIDALLTVLVQSWLGVGFHIFVLFWIFQGLQANMQLKARER